MFRGTFADKPTYLALTPVPGAEKTTSFHNPLGEEPADGYILMRRADLDQIDINAISTLTFELTEERTNTTQRKEWNGLVVRKEPRGIATGQVSDDSLFIVEISDCRWRVHNPYFTQSINKIYNVSSNASNGAGGPGVYLDDSLHTGNITDATNATPIVITSSGHGLETGEVVTITGVGGNTAANDTWTITVVSDSTFSLDTSVGNGAYTTGGEWALPWTWERMIEDVWTLMSTQLGTFPGLPFTPTDYPRGWVHHGSSAWRALSSMLARIGCAVRVDHSLEVGSQCSIVRVGEDDAEAEAVLAAADVAKLQIIDSEFQEMARGRLPAYVRVFFHRQKETPTTIPPFLENGAPHSVDFANPDGNGETGVYHPLWADLPAIYDGGGSLTNGSACNALAAELGADYFRMMTDGGNRLWKRYSGMIDAVPGSTIKSAAWTCHGPREGADFGLFTDIVNHSFVRRVNLSDQGSVRGMMGPDGMDYQQALTVGDLVRLGFPSTAGAGSGDDTTINGEDGPDFTFVEGTGIDIAVTDTNEITISATGTIDIATDPTTETATGSAFTFKVGTSGTDFNVAAESSDDSVTWHLPDAGVSARGAVTTGTQNFAGLKTFQDSLYVLNADQDGAAEQLRVCGGTSKNNKDDLILSTDWSSHSGSLTLVDVLDAVYARITLDISGGLTLETGRYKVIHDFGGGPTLYTGIADADFFGLQVVGGLITGGSLSISSAELGFSATGPGIVVQASNGAALTVDQESDYGQLMDSTGGTPTGNLGAVSGTGDDTTINDNFSSINAKLDAIRAVMQATKQMA